MVRQLGYTSKSFLAYRLARLNGLAGYKDAALEAIFELSAVADYKPRFPGLIAAVRYTPAPCLLELDGHQHPG